MRYPKFLLFVIMLPVIVVGCMGTEPVNEPEDDSTQNEIHFLRQKPSDAPDMEALLQGRLVLSERCLYIRREDVNSTHTAIWPFEFSLTVQGDSIQILNGDKEIVARVGDRILVSGGGIPQLPLEEFEANFIGTTTECTAPYWIVNNDVEVVNP